MSFIASGLATPVNPAIIDAAENDPDSAVAMMISWGFGQVGHKHQGRIPGNSMAVTGQKVMGRNPQGLAADLRACDAYKNGRQAARKISCPHQVILASNDRMAPRRAGMELVENLSGPELHIVEGSGHMLPIERPDQCRQLLRNFIFANNPSS